jgi:hypothetical protein
MDVDSRSKRDLSTNRVRAMKKLHLEDSSTKGTRPSSEASTQQATPTKDDLLLDDEEEGGSVLGPALLKQALANTQAIRELQGRLVAVILLMQSRPVGQSVAYASRKYSNAVRGTKGAQKWGPPHIHRGMAMMEAVCKLVLPDAQIEIQALKAYSLLLKTMDQNDLAEIFSRGEMQNVQPGTSGQSERSESEASHAPFGRSASGRQADSTPKAHCRSALDDRRRKQDWSCTARPERETASEGTRQIDASPCVDKYDAGSSLHSQSKKGKMTGVDYHCMQSDSSGVSRGKYYLTKDANGWPFL